MARPRKLPYVHVSWLAKLMAGEARCEWGTWFRSQHLYDKRPGSDNYAGSEHQVKHTRMVDKERAELVDDGYAVKVDRQNNMSLNGKVATLGGSPNLIAVSGDECLIVEVKTSAPCASHEVQLKIYMWAVPRALPAYSGKRVRGLLVYEDEHRFVEPESVTQAFADDVAARVRRLADPSAPGPKTPSARECKYCPLTDADCPDRFVEELIELDGPDDVETDAF